MKLAVLAVAVLAASIGYAAGRGIRSAICVDHSPDDD